MQRREEHRRRLERHRNALWVEARRIAEEAGRQGARYVVVFGSLAGSRASLTSDLDLLLVWDLPIAFVERSAEAYRRLKPAVAADLLVYTAEEFRKMRETNPLVRKALEEGMVLYEA